MRCRGRAVAAGLVLALAAAGCARDDAPGAEAPAAKPTPVVVDTDMSTDDILALLYVAARRDLDLRAVVVSGTGLTRCPVGARNAAALLAAVGRDDVPVACGLLTPRAGHHEYPAQWRDRADELFGLELPASSAAPVDADGVALLRAAISEAPAATVLLSLAPMTDVAALLEEHDGVRGAVARIVAMAGAVEVPGNVGPPHERAEYNVWVDPAAAASVVDAGVPLTLVPLDATNDVPATKAVADVLDRHGGATPAAGIARDLFAAAGMSRGGQYFWDVLAAAAIARPGLLAYRREGIDVVTSGPYAGRTAADGSRRPVRVAVGAERRRFERELLATLFGHARFELPRAAPGASVTFDGERCLYRGPAAMAAGDATVESVNRSEKTAFRLVIARLAPGRTVAELAAALESPTGRVEAPPWLTLEWSGDTPPRSEMTWVIAMSPPGSKVVGCTVGETDAWIAAPLRVTRNG